MITSRNTKHRPAVRFPTWIGKMVVLLGFTSATATGWANEDVVYQCTQGGSERVITIDYQTPGQTVPCKVTYDSGKGTETLWSANNQQGYCESQANNFLAKQADWGWNCSRVSSDAQSTKAISSTPLVANQGPFPTGYFRLTSQFREGFNECLESRSASNRPIEMQRCQNVSGQLWKATAAGNGYYKLTSMFREDHNECLESNAMGNARSHMDICQNVTGQLWKTIDVGGGYFRMTSQFREAHNECLESNQPNNGGSHMDRCQNVSGQIWKAIAIQSNQPLPENAPSAMIARSLDDSCQVSLTINFNHNSAELTSDARRTVAKLAQAISTNSLASNRFELQGHTDASGDTAYNQNLSESRVISVATELRDIHGVDLSRIVPIGYGESRLLDPSHPESEVNRRVEIHKLDCASG